MTATTVTINLTMSETGNLLINGVQIPNLSPTPTTETTRKNKLSRDTVRDIYRAYHTSKLSTRTIARNYKVGKSTVFEIVSGEARRKETLDLDN